MANKESNYSRYVVDEEDDLPGQKAQKKVKTDYTKIIEETKLQGEDENDNDILPQQKQRVIDTETDYQKRKYQQRLSPEREDRSYRERMKEQLVDTESAQIKNEMEKMKQQQKEEGKFKEPSKASKPSKFTTTMQQPVQSGHSTDTDWNDANQTPKLGNKWDTPSHRQALGQETPRSQRARRRWDATPSQETPSRKIGSKFGETPTPSHFQTLQTPGTVNRFGQTPGSNRMGNQRWDDKTPVYSGGAIAQTPQGMAGMTPSAQTPLNYQNMTAEDFQKMRIERDIDYRNRPLANEELDQMLPGTSEGYEIMTVPESYVPQLNPATKLLQLQQTPSLQTPSMYNMPSETPMRGMEVPGTPSQGLPGLKPEDYKSFASLLQDVNEGELTEGERKERKILMLLLKIKNGTPQQRKSAMRQITQNARELGAGPLFNQILPPHQQMVTNKKSHTTSTKCQYQAEASNPK